MGGGQRHDATAPTAPYRRRLRPAWSPEQLATIYARPHDHRIYGYGHHLRVEATIVLGRWLVSDFDVHVIADLSTGNAVIPKALARHDIGRGMPRPTILGDYAPGYDLTGPIEATVEQIDDVDLFVCSETVEHLDDPEHVLRAIARTSRLLLLSTPIGEDDLGNPEHYWGWNQVAVEAMLRDTGWTPRARTDVVLPDTYSYQIWAAERA